MGCFSPRNSTTTRATLILSWSLMTSHVGKAKSSSGFLKTAMNCGSAKSESSQILHLPYRRKTKLGYTARTRSMDHFVEKRFEPVTMAIPRVLFAESPRRVRKSRLRALFEHIQYHGFELIRIAGILNNPLA